MDIDSNGTFAYVAVPAQQLIYKLCLLDGSLSATCRLPFGPVSLALDEKHKILYAADGAGRRVVQIRLF